MHTARGSDQDAASEHRPAGGLSRRPAAPADADAARSGKRHWQFNLRLVFWIVTGLGVVLAIAAQFGTGTIPLTVAVLSAAANRLGKLRPVQRGTPRRRMMQLAGLLFAVSMVLPSASGCNGERIYGAELVWMTGNAQLGVLLEFFRPGSTLIELGWFLNFGMLNLANLLMLLAACWLGRLERPVGRCCLWTFSIASVFVWCQAMEDPNSFLIGYYVWTASFLLVFTAVPLSRARLVTMMAVSAGWFWITG